MHPRKKFTMERYHQKFMIAESGMKNRGGGGLMMTSFSVDRKTLLSLCVCSFDNTMVAVG